LRNDPLKLNLRFLACLQHPPPPPPPPLSSVWQPLPMPKLLQLRALALMEHRGSAWETKAGAKANNGGRGGKEGGNGRKGAEAQETLGVCQRSPQLFSGSWFPGVCGGQARACHGLLACTAPDRLTAWPHDCPGHATTCQHANTMAPGTTKTMTEHAVAFAQPGYQFLSAHGRAARPAHESSERVSALRGG